jgi:hypothetical protein
VSTDPAVQIAATVQHRVDQQYRYKHGGRERPGPRWSDQACAAWREAHRRAGMTGAWTTTPVASAVALLDALAGLGTCNGAELARHAGVQQGQATSVTLPRFERLNLVSRSTDAEGVAGRTGRPTRWTITRAGRELARVLRDGRLR